MTLTQRLEAPRSGLIVGAGAGLAGGIVAAAVLSIVGIKGRQGEVTRAITLVSHTGGVHLCQSPPEPLGALFGVLYTASGLRRESAATWSTIYGLAWWIGGWFAVMPPPLRFAPWAAVKDPALFQLAVAGLLACLGFGAALAGAFSVFGRAGDSTRDARVRAGHAVAPRPTAR